MCVCNVHILNILGWPYVPFFPDASWSGFLYCLKYLGFSTVCVCIPIGVWHRTLQTVPYVFKTLSRFFDVKHWSFWATLLLSSTHLICTRNCIVLTIDPTFSPVVDKVHRSSTWVKVQIHIVKYYSSKSKSTAFSILLEWKYKSTQFFMYLSKKVLIDRFI